MHANAKTAICNINYVAGVLGMKHGDVARVMGISSSALYRRKQRPWTLTIGEIEKVTEYARRHGIGMTVPQIMAPLVPSAESAAEDPA